MLALSSKKHWRVTTHVGRKAQLVLCTLMLVVLNLMHDNSSTAMLWIHLNSMVDSSLGSSSLSSQSPSPLTRLLTNPNSTQSLINLSDGPHFFTVLSGCRFARWVLPWYSNTKRPGGKYDDCGWITGPKKHLTSVEQLRDMDTIYVTHVQLADFVSWIWKHKDSLNSDIIVISGQFHLTGGHKASTVQRLLDHPRIKTWFTTNLPMFGGNQTQQHHPKVAPFAYGLQEKTDKSRKPFGPLEEYKTIFLQGPKQPKGNLQPNIFAGYLLQKTSPGRKNIPIGPKLEPTAFYQEIQQNHYILSPDGDRPECYRHYEALGWEQFH